jgi:hypothetical protein
VSRVFWNPPWDGARVVVAGASSGTLLGALTTLWIALQGLGPYAGSGWGAFTGVTLVMASFAGAALGAACAALTLLVLVALPSHRRLLALRAGSLTSAAAAGVLAPWALGWLTPLPSTTSVGVALAAAAFAGLAAHLVLTRALLGPAQPSQAGAPDLRTGHERVLVRCQWAPLRA